MGPGPIHQIWCPIFNGKRACWTRQEGIKASVSRRKIVKDLLPAFTSFNWPSCLSLGYEERYVLKGEMSSSGRARMQGPWSQCLPQRLLGNSSLMFWVSSLSQERPRSLSVWKAKHQLALPLSTRHCFRFLNASCSTWSHIPVESGSSVLRDSLVSPTCLSGLPCLKGAWAHMLGVVGC